MNLRERNHDQRFLVTRLRTTPKSDGNAQKPANARIFTCSDRQVNEEEGQYPETFIVTESMWKHSIGEPEGYMKISTQMTQNKMLGGCRASVEFGILPPAYWASARDELCEAITSLA